LIAFRDFVLDRYVWNVSKDNDLTLLVRQNYAAHPRSNGVANRTLANMEEDVAYLQSLSPHNTIQVISFEVQKATTDDNVFDSWRRV
jgi:hypothetical protein